MKLVTDNNEEIAIKDLQSIIISDTQKVVITIEEDTIINTPFGKVIIAFDDFFGQGRWMLTSNKISLEAKDE